MGGSKTGKFDDTVLLKGLELGLPNHISRPSTTSTIWSSDDEGAYTRPSSSGRQPVDQMVKLALANIGRANEPFLGTEILLR